MDETVIIIADENGKNKKFVHDVYDYILKKEDRTFQVQRFNLDILKFRDKEKNIK